MCSIPVQTHQDRMFRPTRIDSECAASLFRSLAGRAVRSVSVLGCKVDSCLIALLLRLDSACASDYVCVSVCECVD